MSDVVDAECSSCGVPCKSFQGWEDACACEDCVALGFDPQVAESKGELNEARIRNLIVSVVVRAQRRFGAN